MAFSTTELAELVTLLAASDGGSALAQQYRERFPSRSLTRCDSSDMGAEEPYRTFPAVDLYLVDGRDHCWHITSDPLTATGVVLARRRRPT
jgi:hypothetical protein